MSQFQIQPLERFGGRSAAIKRPREIACFSYDDEHRYRPDDSSIQYYYPPTRLPVNLCEGFERFKKHDDSVDEHLDSLLKTIIGLEKRTGKRCEADVVTWRGMMTKIMAVPFDQFSTFEMNATCFQGTIFIEECHDAKMAAQAKQSRQRPRPGAPSNDMMSYWGYKFETLSLIPDIWDNVSRDYIESREQKVVSNEAQYCSVVRTGIGHSSLIIGGEVDAIWDQKPTDPDEPINWVELKTSADIVTAHDTLKFERKLLKFWIQSFLLGVPKIIVGFRTPDGVLTRLQELETQKIPAAVKRGTACWDGNVCINFAAGFLDFLKRTIREEGGLWKIRRRERSPVIEVFLEDDGGEDGFGGVLSREFVEWRGQLAAREREREKEGVKGVGMEDGAGDE